MRKGVNSGEGSEEGHAGPEEVRAQLLLPLCCKLGEQKGGGGRKNDPFTELMDVSCWGSQTPHRRSPSLTAVREREKSECSPATCPPESVFTCRGLRAGF